MSDFNSYWQLLVASNPSLRSADRLSLSIDEFKRMLAKTWNDAKKVPSVNWMDELWKGAER
jgi:hypothetical protein